MSEEKQSAIVAREMLTNMANGIPVSIWYDWRDDGFDPNEAEHHFGLVRNAYQNVTVQPYAPKPAYLAARTLLALFDGYTFEKRLNVGNDADYILAFRKGDSLYYAAWTASTPHKIFLPVNGNSIHFTTHLGEKRVLTPMDQRLRVNLSSAPIYVGP